MANAIVAQNAAGDYAIGVTVDGVFVPGVVIPASKVGHAKERQENLEAGAKEGNDSAKVALADGFKVPKQSKAKAEPEGGEG